MCTTADLLCFDRLEPAPSGLDPALELHHIVVNTWEGGVTSPQNVVLISIPVGRHGLAS